MNARKQKPRYRKCRRNPNRKNLYECRRAYSKAEANFALNKRRKKLTTSIVLATATLISVLFLVYAFVQKLEADNQKLVAERMREEALKQKSEAVFEKKRAIEALTRVNNQLVSTLQELEKCRNSKSNK